MQIPHSILGQFLDRGLAAWQVENRVSIVPSPTYTTQASAIYKLPGGLGLVA
jgi:hypothetical protein